MSARARRRSERSIYDGKSCWQAAMTVGRIDLAELLAKNGAREELLVGVDAFVSACNLGDSERAAALLDEHPEHLDRSDPLIDAASHGGRDAVATMLALGMDPNRPGQHGHRPLHNACEDRATVDLLLAHGADPSARVYGGTTPAWARHAGNSGMARFFAARGRDRLDAVLAGDVVLAEELLREDPSRVHARAPGGATRPRCICCPRTPRSRPLVDLLLAGGIDVSAVDDDGVTAAPQLETQGLDELADLLDIR